jgi:dephospho-CoA kinase
MPPFICCHWFFIGGSYLSAMDAPSLQTKLQRRIGLTGGIATGKSSVANLLRLKYHLPLLDADRYAREALAPGTKACDAVLKHFGIAITNSNQPKSINRKALGEIVFNQPSERLWLEKLIHPIVQRHIAQELTKLAAVPTVILMIPLLFEAGLESLCTEIWLVDCTEEQQLERLIKRDQCSIQEALARINAQWPLARKRLLVDKLIDNSGSSEQLEKSVAFALDHFPA